MPMKIASPLFHTISGISPIAIDGLYDKRAIHKYLPLSVPCFLISFIGTLWRFNSWPLMLISSKDTLTTTQNRITQNTGFYIVVH